MFIGLGLGSGKEEGGGSHGGRVSVQTSSHQACLLGPLACPGLACFHAKQSQPRAYTLADPGRPWPTLVHPRPGLGPSTALIGPASSVAARLRTHSVFCCQSIRAATTACRCPSH